MDEFSQPFDQGMFHIAHYYGDYVRQIFLGIAALILVAIPLYASLVEAPTIAEVFGAIILVLCASLISPKWPWALYAAAIVAVFGVVVFEVSAIDAFSRGLVMLFVAREFIAILFLFALYFSIKTIRAMVQHLIGKRTPPGTYR